MHRGSMLSSLIQLLDILVISIQSQLCYCQYCFLFKTSKTKMISARARNSTLQFAALPHLGTNETSTDWIKVWYVADWMTWVIQIFSCSDFLDRTSCCQPNILNSAGRTSSVALQVWPDSCSRHCKDSHSHFALYCFDVFKVETRRECESRLRLLSCAVLSCLPITLPCYCRSYMPGIA